MRAFVLLLIAGAAFAGPVSYVQKTGSVKQTMTPQLELKKILLADAGIAFGDGTVMTTAPSEIDEPFEHPCWAHYAQRKGVITDYRKGQVGTTWVGYGTGAPAILSVFGNGSGLTGAAVPAAPALGREGCTFSVYYGLTYNNGNYGAWSQDSQIDMAQSYRVFAGIITGSDIANQRLWVIWGMNNAATYGGDTIAESDAAAFRYSTTAGDTTWQGCSRGASGTMVCCDTGMAVNDSVYYGFKLERFKNTNPRVEFTVRDWLGNESSCTNSGAANIPSANRAYFAFSADGTNANIVTVHLAGVAAE